MESKQGDAGRDGRICLVRPTSQARTGIGKYSRELYIFPIQLTTNEQDWQHSPVDPYSALSMTIHEYILTLLIHTCILLCLRYFQHAHFNIFPIQLTTNEQDWQHSPVDPYSALSMTIHEYILTLLIHTCILLCLRYFQHAHFIPIVDMGNERRKLIGPW